MPVRQRTNVPPERGNLELRPWSKEDVNAGQTRRDLLRLLGVALVPVGVGCRRSDSSLVPLASALPAVRPTSRAGPAFRADDPAFGEDPAHFPPKRPAEDGDWLARFPETGTTFEEYDFEELLKELRKPRDSPEKPPRKTPKRGVKTVEKRNGGNKQGG